MESDLMQQKERRFITTAWSLIGLASLSLSVNIDLIMHGASFPLPGLQISTTTDRYVASFYGLFSTLPTIFVGHYLTRRFSEDFGEGIWYRNFPVAFNASLYGRLEIHYQFLFLCLFVLLPSLLHLDFFFKYTHGSVYPCSEVARDCFGDVAVVVGWWQHLFSGFALVRCGLRGFRYATCGGIDYFPVIVPLLIWVSVPSHALSLVLTVLRLRPFRRKHRGSHEAHNTE